MSYNSISYIKMIMNLNTSKKNFMLPILIYFLLNNNSHNKELKKYAYFDNTSIFSNHFVEILMFYLDEWATI